MGLQSHSFILPAFFRLHPVIAGPKGPSRS
jgi:hypothetical protein